MRLAITAAILLLFGGSAFSLEPITGAFGINLGDVFEPEGGVKPGQDEYPFTPKVKHPTFLTYYVYITPNTHRVYQIVASGEQESAKIAEERYRALQILLTRRYTEPPFPYSGLSSVTQKDSGNSVTVDYPISRADSLPSLTIRYTSREMDYLADQERGVNLIRGFSAEGL